MSTNTSQGCCQVIVLKNIVLLSEDLFSLINSVDPDEIPHYTAFYLGLHCLLKSRLGGFPYTNGYFALFYGALHSFLRFCTSPSWGRTAHRPTIHRIFTIFTLTYLDIYTHTFLKKKAMGIL